MSSKARNFIKDLCNLLEILPICPCSSHSYSYVKKTQIARTTVASQNTLLTEGLKNLTVNY